MSENSKTSNTQNSPKHLKTQKKSKISKKPTTPENPKEIQNLKKTNNSKNPKIKKAKENFKMSKAPEKPPKSEKEKRIRAITKIYYSNPEVQKAIFEFSQSRELIPRYYEGFGKRPDTLQYQNDFKGLVLKGATSFHASEEIWQDPLKLDSEMTLEEQTALRSAWDLLIDIDSPYLDSSKIAAELIIDTLEKHGVKNYGIKFSGSKGFHIIVPAKAFPEKFKNIETKTMFPEWPRAISEYLMAQIRQEYNKLVGQWDIDYKSLKERTNLSKEDVTELYCPNCSSNAKKGTITTLVCDRCSNIFEKPNLKSKRKLKCIDPSCPGHYEIQNEKEYFFCEACGFSSFDKKALSTKKVIYSKEMRSQKYSEDFKEEITAAKFGSLDLVLVAPRHLFRAPYSLHEKTALASIVITKNEIASFTPKKANPLNVKVKNFQPNSEPGEASNLLELALNWKSRQDTKQEIVQRKKYENFPATDFSGVTDEFFPKPIKKLLRGLQEGRKRGLFILLTFLKYLGFSPADINEKIRDWNKKNEPPLKEGYIRSQIDWHLRQKRKILPPNYANPSFYKDLNLLDKEPKFKNPISEVAKRLRKS